MTSYPELCTLLCKVICLQYAPLSFAPTQTGPKVNYMCPTPDRSDYILYGTGPKQFINLKLTSFRLQ